MCGIAGYLGAKEFSNEKLNACIDLMHRRGPDHAGYYHRMSKSGKNVYLLHSRLSIIDINERSNQPFQIGSKVIVYNGEIYNYLELRDNLASNGQQFNTNSDTEVLLRMIIQYSWKGLDKCEGMWAFAIYDEKEESILLSRDRFGEKPLYIYREEHGIYFGSEIKYIAVLRGNRFPINYQHIYRYLVNGYKSLYKTNDTFFNGVEELKRATILIIDRKGKERKETYWRPELIQDESMTYEEAVIGVKSKIIESVKLRLRADIPISFCMSGGIDSNTLISIAKRIFNYEVHGFTVVNEDERYEEQKFVDHAVKELNIRHTSVSITTKNFWKNMGKLIRQHDAPVFTISYYVQWLLMNQISKHGYRISVSGTGADEIMSGYYDHHNLYLYETKNSYKIDHDLEAWEKRVYPYVRNPYLKDPKLYFKNPRIRDHIYLDNDIFAGYLINEWREEFTESEYNNSILRNRMLNELFNEAVPVILHEDDLNAMYFSIENRSPFLDRNLFEFCCKIPDIFLIRDGYAKVVLRDAMEGIVPQKVLWNPRKVGFNAPVYAFLDVNKYDTRERLLDQSIIFNHIEKNMIEKLISKPKLSNSESKFLFYFVNSKMFLEEYEE